MDRALPIEAIRKRRVTRTLKLLPVPILIVVSVLALRSCIAPSVSRDRLLFSVVERGRIDATLSASGTVAPEYEQVLTCPVQSRVESVLLQPGDSVKPGQPILVLDTERIASRVQKLRDELAFLKNQKKQLLLKLESQAIELEAEKDIKELEAKYAEARLKRTRGLHALGGATDETLSADELDLDIARRQLLRVTKSMENQKASLQAEIDGLSFQVQIKENEIREAQRDLEQARVCPDRPGVVTWLRTDVGSSVNSGDAVARIADLSSYKVEAQISDIHAAKLFAGGPVVVRIGDTLLAGSISSVQPGVVNGIARFDVALEQNDHALLRPNLRADVFVTTASRNDALRVRNGRFYSGRVNQYVFVVRGDEAVRRSVDIGVSDYDFVELIGDVSVGDTVIISDMSRFEHADAVGLKD